MAKLHLGWLTPDDVRVAQQLVTAHHYLRRPVDPRCCPEGYAVHTSGHFAGVLLFGRPQATVCRPWYGSLTDLAAGRVECSRWQVLNLARVYILPEFQRGGASYGPEMLPGFMDRSGVWRSALASTAIGMACELVALDYLLARPPVFLDEPYELRWVLSYCDYRHHRGTLYEASGFERYRVSGVMGHMGTYRRRIRPLEEIEHEAVRRASEHDSRARSFRSRRAAAAYRQLEMATWS